MSLASLNRHSWMEYRYQYANDNEAPRRMWTNDHNNIFEISKNNYVLVCNNGVRVDQEFSTVEEAKEYQRSRSSAG
jgi:hypothetical protein